MKMGDLYPVTDQEKDISLEVDNAEIDGNADDSETVDISKPETEDLPEKILKLPLSRIKRIIKIDPDVSLASREAVFLITKATELLLDSLAKEAYTYTAKECKKTVTKKHLNAAINNTDALAFLDGILD